MKTIELTEYIYHGHDNSSQEKITIKLDSIVSYSSNGLDSLLDIVPLTTIRLSNSRCVKVTESYSEVRELINSVRHDNCKRCYSFRMGISNHYVPIDLIERMSVDSRTGHITLYVGKETFVTGHTLEELKQTAIDLNM